MSKLKSFFRITLLITLVFGVFFATGAGLGNFFFPSTEKTTDQAGVEDKERTNILFLGVDARPGDTKSRSDTMILASIDPELNRVAVVSIPRDTKINGTAGSGMDKINSANIVGGPELAVETVEGLMGENIDYYVEMDFQGFKKIIDVLGGVTINVDQRMYKPSEDIDLKPGVQKLDGADALAFVRFRGYVNGDIDRTTHQQEFIKALGKELLKPATIAKLPQLIRQADTYVDTNLRLSDMLKIASWAPGFSSESIVAQTLPGYFYDQRNAQGVLTQSYWIADSQQAKSLLDKMMTGQTVAVLVDPPASARTTTSSGTKAKTKTPSQSEIDKTNKERSNLPSAGHGVKI